MELNLEQDIRSVTDLKRQTKEVLAHAQLTQRPVVITLNGRADAVLLNASAYEKLKLAVSASEGLKADGAERFASDSAHTDPISGQTFRGFKQFWQEFRYAHKVNA